MKVNSIHLQNTVLFNDAEIEFHNGINVIAGSNASGKSFILRAIANAWTFVPNQSQIEGSFYNLANGLVQFRGAITISFNSRHIPSIATETELQVSFQKEEQGQLITNRPKNNNVNFPVIIAPSMSLITSQPILAYIDSFRGVAIGGYDQTQNEIWRNQGTSQRFGKILRLYEIIFDQEGSLESKYQDILHKFFPYMATVKKIRTQPPNSRVMDVESFSAKHQMAGLASGCVEILFIVGETAFLQNSVIIIDEPELHLHPLAQDMLSKYLNYLTTPEGGRNQVIIATHSLSLIYGGRSGRVINLRREDDKVRPERVINENEPTLEFVGALENMGYSGHAIKEAREMYREFKQKQPSYTPPAQGGWALGE
jgi:energy-coupling factor transporter ATP-binding protein EcfA2